MLIGRRAPSPLPPDKLGAGWLPHGRGDARNDVAMLARNVRLADPPAPVQVMVALGETARDPETPVGEKPFPAPLEALALALVQVRVTH